MRPTRHLAVIAGLTSCAGLAGCTTTAPSPDTTAVPRVDVGLNDGPRP